MSEKLYYIDNITIFRVIYFSLKHEEGSSWKDDLELDDPRQSNGCKYLSRITTGNSMVKYTQYTISTYFRRFLQIVYMINNNTDRTLDVVFSFTIKLRQKLKGVKRMTS